MATDGSYLAINDIIDLWDKLVEEGEVENTGHYPTAT
jgi:hypothetical protein